MSGQVCWWRLFGVVVMLIVYGLAGTADLEYMECAEASRGAVYVTGW